MQNLDVNLDFLAHAWALHLDRHFCTVMQYSMVNLGHRRGGERLAIERLEQLGDRRTQITFDNGDYLLAGHRLNGVLQAGEGFDIVRWQQIRPGTEKLPHFDETWS